MNDADAAIDFRDPPQPVVGWSLKSVAVLLLLMLAATACSFDNSSSSTEETGALGAALETESAVVAEEMSFPGIGLEVKLDQKVSELGLFDASDSHMPTLDLEWNIEVTGFACPDCESGVRIEVDSVIFVDRFERVPKHTTTAGLELNADSSSPFALSSTPVLLEMNQEESHCLVLLSSIRLLRDGEVAASVNIDSMYQVGSAETFACSLASQAEDGEQGEASAMWKASDPQDSFACQFGRLLPNSETDDLLAEVNACENPQLLVAVPLQGDGTTGDCCFHWYGVPSGQAGSILVRDIDDLELGSWRSILLSQPPTSGANYDGPHVVFNWPGIVDIE